MFLGLVYFSVVYIRGTGTVALGAKGQINDAPTTTAKGQINDAPTTAAKGQFNDAPTTANLPHTR